MPVGVRGGSRVRAKPPVRAASGPRAAKTAKTARRAHGLSARGTLALAMGVLVVVGVLVLATGHRGQRLAEATASAIDGRFGAAGFRLANISVEGASPAARADIIKAAGVTIGQPLVGVDLQAVRRRVQAVGWVKDARVVRLLPDTLVVAVTERRQMAVWQHAGRSLVIDEHGQPIPEADPARFAALPLVVGAGAAERAPAILPILAQRPKLMERMDALVRVDDRRWDLRLKDGSLIQLPAEDEERALVELERLDQRSRILELGFERIDLRNPDVVAVRPRATPAPGLAPAAGA